MEIVLARVQQAIAPNHSNPAYRRALQSILSLLRKYISKLSSASHTMTSVASDGAQSLPTFTPVIWTDDPDLLRLASELSDPLSRFTSGYDIQNIFSALYAVLWDVANIPASASDAVDADVRVFFGSLGRWIDTALNDPAYAVSVSGRRTMEGLYDEARTFMSQSSRSDASEWVRDLHVLIREIEAFTTAIENDKTTRRFFTALDSLTDALSAFSSRTAARHTLRHLQTDLARWLVPRLLRAVRAVPVPHVEYASPRVHATVDALFLASHDRAGVDVDVDLVPARVRLTTTNTVSVDLRDDAEVGVRGATRSVSLHVDGVRFAVRDVGYSVRYTPPLWFGFGMLGYIDEGYVSMEVGSGSGSEGGVSIDVDVDMDVHPSSSGSSLEDEEQQEQQQEPNPLFTISSVHLSIPHFRLTTHDTRHPIVNALLGRLARPLVAWYLTRQVYVVGDALGRVLGAVEHKHERRLRSSSSSSSSSEQA